MATSLEEPHQMQTPVHCDTCENTAKHLCKSCHDRLCDRCKDIHSKSKASFDHKVVSLTFEALTSSSESPSHLVCKWHPKFRASIGCQKCEVPVCDQCLIREHNGHNVIAIVQLFQIKKEKLEQKLTTFRSELPKYESELEKVKGRQKDVPQHKESTIKAIDDYFKRAISTLDGLKQELLDNVDAKTSADINVLKDQENTLQTYIQNMREYMVNFQIEDLQEKLAFIFYTLSSTDDIPKECPSFSSPGILKYSEGCLEKNLMHRISGNVWKSPKNSKLLEKEELQTIKIVQLGNGQIESLCYDSGFYWVFLSNKSSFIKYNEDGSCVEKLKVNIEDLKNKPFCVVDMEGVHAVYRKDRNKLFMMKYLKKELFIDAAPAAVACVCVTRDGDILAGLVHSTESLFALARFNLKGECKYYITHTMKNWSPETLYQGNSIRAYMAENMNKDICLSIEKVHVICANGFHRFSYGGTSMPQPFLPRGLCTNTLGHILVADENNLGIHVLDKDGIFLAMLTIPGEAKVTPISLCTDNQMNLYALAVKMVK